MADITKCKGVGCIKRRLCYRFTAPDTPHWQAWFCKPPNTSTTQCTSFWSNKGRNAQTKNKLVIREGEVTIVENTQT